jgi:hypothetical protein
MMMADNSQSGMMPVGQLAPVGTVEKDSWLALDQGSQSNMCRIGSSTQVRAGGRLVLMKENETEPYAFAAGFSKLRVYYRKEAGSRFLEFVETDFHPIPDSDFWGFDASVLTSDPASLRYYVLNPVTSKWVGPVDAERLEKIPGPSPLPNCYQATQMETSSPILRREIQP